MDQGATDENTIYPTYECFNDALEFLLLHSGRLMLVHGICLYPDDGHKYAHAWVEQDGRFVIFAGIHLGKHKYFAALRAEYYTDAKVQEATKYTPREAAMENLRSGHYGPWLEKYKRLCREVTGSPA